MTQTINYKYGFVETVADRQEAEAKLRESSDTDNIKIDDNGRCTEWLQFGTDGPGWYFVGQIYEN
jgi:hypothetical protein